MPTKLCSVCNRLQTIPSKQWGYLDNSGDFVCSKECVIEWVLHAKMPKAALQNVEYLSRDRGNEEYSQKMKMYFRSRYELLVAEELYNFGFRVRYEEIGFQLRDGLAHYVPDFYILDHCLIEVKGKWGVGGKKKMRRFRDDFPEVPLLVIPWNIKSDFYRGKEHNVIC